MEIGKKEENMKDLGIFDRNITVTQGQENADNGAVVVVVVAGRPVLRRYSRQNGRIVLHAENPAFEELAVASEQDVLIAGRLVA